MCNQDLVFVLETEARVEFWYWYRKRVYLSKTETFFFNAFSSVKSKVQDVHQTNFTFDVFLAFGFEGN